MNKNTKYIKILTLIILFSQYFIGNIIIYIISKLNLISFIGQFEVEFSIIISIILTIRLIIVTALNYSSDSKNPEVIFIRLLKS